jgi:hypothetical protein
MIEGSPEWAIHLLAEELNNELANIPNSNPFARKIDIFYILNVRSTSD